MNGDHDYIKLLKVNKERSEEYYQKFLIKKSEQQKFLEKLLSKENFNPELIADIACGSGTLTYHINKIYPSAKYLLVDLNDEALKLAQENNKMVDAEYLCESIYDLRSISSFSSDLVFCWQTLSWIDNPEKALKELIRICKPDGKIYLSSLFNTYHDVDIYSKVLDKTNKATPEKIYVQYNTFSDTTIKEWIEDLVKEIKIVPFEPDIDFNYSGKGLGTYTLQLQNGTRLQISGGLMMNWGILIIRK